MALSLVVAAIGDRWSGKSSLYVTYTTKCFPEHHVTAAEVEDCDPVIYTLSGGQKVALDFFEVSGDMYDFTEIRHFNYRRSNIIMLCFSVVRPASLANILKRWAPEVKQFTRKRALVLLVGTQTDLRTEKQVLDKMAERKETPVSYEQGRQTARKIKAEKYLECSAKTNQGVDEVFDEIGRLVELLEKRESNEICVVS